MHRNPFHPVFIAAALSACAAQPELLNSDRIKERFGSYGINVLAADGNVRRSSLYSTDNGERTSRTYAVVRFVGSNVTDISATHQKVVAGSSIGSTFRTDGWDVVKRTVYIGEIAMQDLAHPVAQRMRLGEPGNLALHAYQLHIEKNSISLHYATIIEIHHPDYLSQDELLEIYPLPDGEPLSDDDVAALVALVLSGD